MSIAGCDGDSQCEIDGWSDQLEDLASSNPTYMPTMKHSRRTRRCLALTVQRLLVKTLALLPPCPKPTPVADRYPVGTTAVHLLYDFLDERGACVPRVEAGGERFPWLQKEQQQQQPDGGGKRGVWQYVEGAACESSGWFCLFAATPKSEDELTRTAVETAAGGAEWEGCAADAEVAKASEVLTDKASELVLIWQTPVTLRTLLLAGAMAELLTTPSADVRAWTRGRETHLRGHLSAACRDTPIISLHMRQGDRCHSGSNLKCPGLHVVQDALQEIKSVYGSCRLRLATDSAAVIEELQTDSELLHDWHVSWLSLNRSIFTAAKDGSCTPMPHCQFIENRRQTLGTPMRDVGMSITAEMDYLAGGDVFIGGFDTNIGRLIYVKMAGRLGSLPPFFHYQEDEELLKKNIFTAMRDEWDEEKATRLAPHAPLVGEKKLEL